MISIYPPPVVMKDYYKEHQCRGVKREKKRIVRMHQGIDGRYFVGVCLSCGERIVEKKEIL